MTARVRFLDEFSKAIVDDAAALFIGAGVSAGAGYPSWRDLLRDIGHELGVDTGDVQDLAALAQWSVRRSAGRTRVNQVIRAAIAPDRPIPETLRTVARLPIRNIWTTNYDRLIERAFAEISRPVEPISIGSDLAIRPRPGAVRLFKMHGSIDRLDDIVIATDDYELYRIKRGPFLPLLQAHMTSFSMLFVGLSLTDQNVRHVLSLVRENFTGSPPEHFAIVRPPQREEFKSKKQHLARLSQHNHWADDLQRYGLQVVEIDDYNEVGELMIELERRLANRQIWISGSWPLSGGSPSELTYVVDVAAAIGQQLGENGFSLVSGSGLAVSSAAISGFLSALQKNGAWDLERRLIARPFPQALEGREPDRKQWAALRAEMARLAGVIIFIGGAKLEEGRLVDAAGVREELEAALKAGAFLVPIGSTGGIAKAIAEELIDMSRDREKDSPPRPTKSDLQALMKKDDPSVVARLVVSILSKHSEP